MVADILGLKHAINQAPRTTQMKNSRISGLGNRHAGRTDRRSIEN